MTRTIVSSFAMFGVAAGLYFTFPAIDLPGRTDDAIRYIVIAQCFFGLGLMGFVLQHLGRLKVDSLDEALTPLRWVAVSYFGATIFVALSILEKTGTGPLTWRTPLAAIVFFFADIGLLRLFAQMRRVASAVPAHLVVKIESNQAK